MDRTNSRGIAPLLYCFILILIEIVLAQDVQLLNTRIVATFPTPCQSPAGLAWDGKYLCLVDNSEKLIYSIDTNDGTVISSVELRINEVNNIAFVDGEMWAIEKSNGMIYQDNMQPIIAIGDIIGVSQIGDEITFTGLEWDGEYLWAAIFAGWSSKVYKIDVLNGKISFSFYSDVDDLAFDGKYLWGLDSQHGHSQGFVKKYDITNGKQLAYFLTPENLPTGLAFDGKYFWIVDNDKNLMYKIVIED